MTTTGNKSLPGVVILGCPRSGTSLLASMMERRFDYAAPVESHFVRYFDPLVRRFQPRSHRELMRLGDSIMCFLDRWVPINNRVRSRERALAYSLAALQDEIPSIVGDCENFADLVGGLFSRFASRESRLGWVEQSVYADPPEMGFLGHYPSGTKFIHLVRDGRDVWISWKRTWFRPASLEQTADWWCGHVRRAHAWGVEHPQDYFELRYEDLLADAAGVMRKLAEFVGAELLAEADSRNSPLSEVLKSGGTHDRIGEAPSMESVGRWKSEMSEDDVHRFERIAAKQLAAFSYELSPGFSAKAGAAGGWPLGIAALRGGLSANNLRRQLKRMLPYVCWMRHRIKR